jgi:hypothetical protein
MQAAKDRAFVRKNTVNAFHGFTNTFRRSKVERDVNSPDHEYAIFSSFDLAADVGREPAIAGVNLARFQRAPEGSQHSATGGGNNVIDRCRMRFAYFVFVDSVVLRDCAMHAERNRLLLTRQICKA